MTQGPKENSLDFGGTPKHVISWLDLGLGLWLNGASRYSGFAWALFNNNKFATSAALVEVCASTILVSNVNSFFRVCCFINHFSITPY